MKGVNRQIVIVMFCIFLITLVSGALAADNMFVCDLAKCKIGPKPSDTDATGNVVFYLDKNKNELSYKLMVEKIKDTYMAHLHLGSSDKEGIIAAWLYPSQDHGYGKRIIEGEYSGILADGVIRQEDLENGITFEQLIESLRAGNAYVNVHTQKFVMGAIRGQVEEKSIIAGASF
jgi:hypothetical protein